MSNVYFPSAWKIAKILPIKKTRDAIKLKDFRPISLLSNVGELFEHVLKEKLANLLWSRSQNCSSVFKGITPHNMLC